MKRVKNLWLGIVGVALVSMVGTVCAADAKALYEKECAKCHGANGNGDTKMGKKLGAKDYTSAKVQAEMKDDQAFKAIKEGLKEGDKTLMKPTEGVTDADIKALVAHMKTFKK
jgi:cytochrome c553